MITLFSWGRSTSARLSGGGRLVGLSVTELAGVTEAVSSVSRFLPASSRVPVAALALLLGPAAISTSIDAVSTKGAGGSQPEGWTAACR